MLILIDKESIVRADFVGIRSASEGGDTPFDFPKSTCLSEHPFLLEPRCKSPDKPMLRHNIVQPGPIEP